MAVSLHCVHVAVLILTSGVCMIWASEREGFVLELDEEDFDSTISSHSVILVEFYAPWCGHCKSLAPEYEKAAEMLSSVGLPLASVDATVHQDLAARYGVTGYPTLKVFHDGVAYDYEGPRMTAGIVEYMQNENRADWRPPADSVLVLTSDNFSRTIESAPLILVEFYAPWCGHCKRLEPEYKKAASDLSQNNILLAKVDATAEPDLAREFNVEGYPTLFMFRKGIKFAYDGPRERQGIVRYMLDQSEQPFIQLGNTKDFLLASTDRPLVLLCSMNMSDDFLLLANEGRGSPLMFAHSISPELCKHIGLDMEAAAIVYPTLYRSSYEPTVMTIDLSVSNLSTILTAARPLVGIRDKTTDKYWYSDHFPLLVAYLDIDTSRDGMPEFLYWRDRLLQVAQLFPELTVAMSDENEFENELTVLGLSDWGEDVAIAIWAGTKKKYPFKDDFDSLETFIQECLSGHFKPYLRSQPVPKNNHGPVVSVVGSTFEKIVMDPTKHVLVEIFAPWCGHCKALEPKYKQLAKKFKKQSDIVISKFDGTANEVMDGFDVSGFPVLFFVSAGNNEVIEYKGDREVNDMAEFIKKSVKTFKQKAKDEL